MATFQVNTNHGEFKIQSPTDLSASIRKEIERSIRKVVDEDAESVDHLLREIEEEIPDVDTPQNALLAYMSSQGWSQKRLEKESGVPQSNISKYLKGELGIGKTVAKKFAKAFGVDYRKFL